MDRRLLGLARPRRRRRAHGVEGRAQPPQPRQLEAIGCLRVGGLEPGRQRRRVALARRARPRGLKRHSAPDAARIVSCDCRWRAAVSAVSSRSRIAAALARARSSSRRRPRRRPAGTPPRRACAACRRLHGLVGLQPRRRERREMDEEAEARRLEAVRRLELAAVGARLRRRPAVSLARRAIMVTSIARALSPRRRFSPVRAAPPPPPSAALPSSWPPSEPSLGARRTLVLEDILRRVLQRRPPLSERRGRADRGELRATGGGAAADAGWGSAPPSGRR